MSYFLCGFGLDKAVVDAFEGFLREVAPDQMKSPGLRLESGSSCLATYGSEKVIPDIAIRNDGDGSWLALVGTALVQLTSERQALAFLGEFLANPARSLRDKIEGNFAAFAYDASNNRIIAGSDFNHTTPVFYAVCSGRVLFSSHELALARIVNAEIDPFGFSQSIQLGVTWNSFTRFRNVQKMLPCQICFTGENARLHTETYWQPEQESPFSGSLEEHIEKWGVGLRHAVWRHHECSGGKPAVADFTAGEDSRLIVAQCHALGIPFKAQVTGVAEDTDVIVAKQAAAVAGFPLMVRQRCQVTEEQVLAHATRISLRSDAYQDFLKSCSEFATDTSSPMDDYSKVKYCGTPGGEAFRGAYYLRGRALFPAKRCRLDSKFFIRMKYLLDYHPGLLRDDDNAFIGRIEEMARAELEKVEEFPVGTQIDHMLRVFQTCLVGLKYKNPLYLPLATNSMTRSIYWLSPRYKRGGRLTKACTELLFPELARVKTQDGVPTIRKTISRMPLFLPEYTSLIKKVSRGVTSRFFKLTKPNSWYLGEDCSAQILAILLHKPPYRDWFSSSDAMKTGHLFNPDVINRILKQARAGSCRYVATLWRILSMELACRWVQ